MISRILVATDGSKVSTKSVEFAVDLTKKIGAEIILLTVIDETLIPATVPDVATPTQIPEPTEDYERQMAEKYLQQEKQVCVEKGVPTRTVVLSGQAVDGIVKEAENLKVDLIVMGSHGKSTLKAALLGSVTFGVIHKNTRIPVLIIRR
jgi:nucleotide-binding universal stress UspA family protein